MATKERKVIQKVKGVRAVDGAGVSLVRVLGNETVYDFDPFLMLDSFDSTNPDDYRRGFPAHPHRGIETVSFIAKGRMTHKDHLGSKQTIGDGEAQWLTAGSGRFTLSSLRATGCWACSCGSTCRESKRWPPHRHTMAYCVMR